MESTGSPPQPQSSSSGVETSLSPLWLRLLAGLIDALLLGSILYLCLKYGFHWAGRVFLCFVAGAAWLEACWRLRGSPGKWMCNLSVQMIGRGMLYRRELLGKLASTATFLVLALCSASPPNEKRCTTTWPERQSFSAGRAITESG